MSVNRQVAIFIISGYKIILADIKSILADIKIILADIRIILADIIITLINYTTFYGPIQWNMPVKFMFAIFFGKFQPLSLNGFS